MSEGNPLILFDKFEVIECYKKDSFAGVYLANHIYLNKKIIVKVLNTALELDNSILERFKREAKILAKLDHPNVIKVLDFGAYENSFYISFEYFESKNLREVIKNNNLSNDNKKNLIIQLFKGLEFAHKNQIIHRDIKPENILVNDKLELKISDFGLALGVNDNFVTAQHSVVGTPCYMSPEQVLGSELTIKSDLFSAGIVVYELFTGKNLFLGNDVNETLNNIINFNEEEKFNSIAFIENDILTILKNLLKKNPDERFKSATDILNLLSSDEIFVDGSIQKQKKRIYNIVLFVSAAIVAVALLFAQYLKVFDKSYDFPVLDKKKDLISLNKTDSLVTIEKEIKDANVIKEKTLISNESLLIYPAKTLNELNNSGDKTAGFGFLYLECNPWAEIYIDNTLIDVTPINENIILTAGSHNLRLNHPGYPAANIPVLIYDKKTEFIKVNLDTLFAFIDFNIFPWGDIYLNGKYLGQTPLQKIARVFPGYQNIVIKNPAYPEYQTKILANNNDTLVIKHRF